MGATKVTKEKRLAAGLCERCGLHPFAEGCKKCDKCRAILREYEAKDRERRRVAGICQKCPNLIVPGRVYCETHLSYGRSQSKKLVELRLEQGLCTFCGDERGDSPSKRECYKCYCQHKETKAFTYQSRKDTGLCVSCGKGKALELVNSCTQCFFKNLSVNHFGSNSRYKELHDLFERQGGRCAITGANLSLGGAASLDHIIPQCRGGTHDINNLRFVHVWINFMKGSKLDEEFLPQLTEFTEILNDKNWVTFKRKT